jgi:type IV pilus assembly protein PilV
MLMGSGSVQRGIGLVEVMVALMLMSVAVLGFSAMQLTAVKATDESIVKTRALTVLRGAAEMMRANAQGIEAFKAAINGTSTTVTNASTDSTAITKNSCVSGGAPEACTINQLAVRDALTVKQYATDNQLKVGMASCPTIRTKDTADDGTVNITSSVGQNRQCLIASWGDTDPIFLDNAIATDTTKDKPCADEDAEYYIGVQCFVVEAY